MREGWHTAHLLVLGLWGGCVLAEAVLEVLGRRDRPSAESAARVHYWIDLLVELPLLAAVLTTGTVLALRTPWTPPLLWKMGLGLTAVLVNLWCLGVVLRRHRRFPTAPPEASEASTGKVFLALALGLPPGLAALALGLMR